ncbi:MAG: pitrilysin family protein [bacterium]|nr:pitrilysin family protein [bacterium]
MSSVTRHVLDNGMVVLLKEVRNAPIISWRVMYRVGSRNERTGITGVSHWVEHMMFKGTDKFPPGVLDKAIDRVGGSWNASTWIDTTAYYETLPAQHIDLALEAEADRMINAKFDPEEVESERTVIISERQGSENSPFFWLAEEVQAAAFRVHGYHHEIIGDMIDLETMTRDDLYQHYKAHYAPNNAVAVAVGDFDSAAMLDRIKALYGALPSGEPVRLFQRPEPPQQGERRVTVERPSGSPLVIVGYRAPAALDADFFPMEMVASLLCGADSVGGSGIDNKTSRLYKALVATELAASVDGGVYPTIDPFLFLIYMTVREGADPEAVIAALDAEIERLRSGDVTEAELARVKKQARALFAYSTERITTQASLLANAEILGDHLWYEQYFDKLNAVTLEQVKAAAAAYLRPQTRTVGVLVPTGGDGDAEYGDGDYADDAMSDDEA